MRGLDAYLDVEESENRGVDRAAVRKLASYILKQWKIFSVGFGALLLGTFAALLEPRIFGYAIDEAIVPRNWPYLEKIALLLLFVTCVRVSAVIAQGYLFEVLGQRVTQTLRVELFSHLEALPIRVYDKNPAGRLVTRVTNDIISLSEMFSAGFVSMIGNALMVVGILAWLLILDFRLGLVTAATFPVLAWSGAYFSARLRVAYRDTRGKLSALNAFLAENLLGARVVQLFNRQALHLERFDRINEWYSDAQVGSVRVFAYFQPTITWVQGLAMAIVVWVGSRAALGGTIKVGALVAFFSYTLSLFQPVREIADKWNVFLSGIASAERIFSIFSWPTEEGSGARPTFPRPPRLELQGRIEFKNVWFAYEGGHWILRDFSLDIPAGTRLGIVGHTGSGKTTLISLLMRFYEIQRGQILIDGRDIREYDRRALRAAIGIVQQDVFLFSGSTSDNVTFWGGAEGASAEALENFWGDLGNSPELVERGANLSMGERQLLAFARATAAKPSIWILDEATANMDSSTELALSRALDQSARHRTSILIAHRLSTVRTADQILVLHKGVAVERGNHAELMKLDGLYARLYRYQSAQAAAQAAADRTTAVGEALS